MLASIHYLLEELRHSGGGTLRFFISAKLDGAFLIRFSNPGLSSVGGHVVRSRGGKIEEAG